MKAPQVESVQNLLWRIRPCQNILWHLPWEQACQPIEVLVPIQNRQSFIMTT